MRMKIAVLLSGCGVYDGAEIQESVFTLAAIARNGGEYQVFAPDVEMHHVIDHTTGNEMPGKRNVLVEAARIARGNIRNITEYDPADFDALIIPGGFGTAKNLTGWAFKGPQAEINAAVASAITATREAGKVTGAFCMGPVVVAKALGNADIHAVLSTGSTEAASPYDIGAIHAGMESLGMQTKNAGISEITIDRENRIVCAPCYMLEAGILEVQNNIETAVKAIADLIRNKA